MFSAPCNSEPAEGLFDLLGELGKGRRGEGEKKDEEHDAADHLSLSIDGRLIVKWHGMPEAEEDHQDEQENPSRIVEDRDETHDSDGDEEDGAALSSEKGIGDMSSIQLSHGKEVEGGDKEADPSGISDGMKHHINIFGNLSHDQSLDEGEEKRVCQADRPFFNLGGRDQC